MKGLYVRTYRKRCSTYVPKLSLDPGTVSVKPLVMVLTQRDGIIDGRILPQVLANQKGLSALLYV